MNSNRKKARFAGLLYLIWVVTGLLGMYVTSKLIVHGNASATINNILTSQFLFRINILDILVSSILWVFLVLALHNFLKKVDKKLSSLMVLMVIIQVPFAFISVLNQFFALDLARGGSFLLTLTTSQREALGMLFLHVDNLETIASEIFWGIWLFPLGLLTLRSRFLPKFLGIWLLLNGLTYVILCFIGLLLPQYYEITFKFAFPLIMGEIAFMLWLLVMGAKSSDQTSESNA